MPEFKEFLFFMIGENEGTPGSIRKNTNREGSPKVSKEKRVPLPDDHKTGKLKIRYHFVPPCHLLHDRLLPTGFDFHLFTHTHQPSSSTFDELLISGRTFNATCTRFSMLEESR